MKPSICPVCKPRHVRVFLLMIVSIAWMWTSGGCATKKAYSGPDLPPDQIAIIRPDQNKAFTEIRIRSVDGYPLEFYESEVAVWPGNHRFSVDVKLAFPYFSDRLGFKQNISLNVEAGRVYTIYSKIDSIKNEGFLWVASDNESDPYVGGAKIGPIKLLTSNP